MSPEIKGIKRNKWQMQKFLNQGITGEALRSAERRYLAAITEVEKNSGEPPLYSPLFPDAPRINYGWAVSAHLLPDQTTVVKVPRGVFPEVNEPAYLMDANDAYEASRQHISPFILETVFDRVEDTNVLFQGRLSNTARWRDFDKHKETPKLKSSLKLLGEGFYSMLEEYQWMPDIQLEQLGDGRWRTWDIAIEDDEPRIYDWTTIYDPYRLSPDTMRQEIKKNEILLVQFIKDMS